MSKPLSIYLGYDAREHAAYEVADFSIRRRASVPVLITPLVLSQLSHLLTRPVERHDGKLWCPISEAPMSTEFAISRFAVPFLQRTGWALFADCDVLCLADIAGLFALADPRYAVLVVKHAHDQRVWKSQLKGQPVRARWAQVGSALFFEDAHDGCTWKQVPIEDKPPDAWEIFGDEAKATLADLVAHPPRKMDGQQQTAYARKNWSSVVLWNCAHRAHERLTPHILNTWPGRDLHAFRWLKDDEIGDLPQAWNWLVGVTPGDPSAARLLHFTLGGPWFPEWMGGPCDDLWIRERCSLTHPA